MTPPARPWPRGAATGIGSLPGSDPLEAARTVFGELPDLPFLPELPARGPGADIIGKQLAVGPRTKRVGLVGLERAPVREGTVIVDHQGHKLGVVTSGTLAPTVNQPVAMAYLPVDHAIVAHEVYAEVRGKRLPMRVAPMPFTPNRYYRG